MRGERRKRSNRFLALVLSFILAFGSMSGLVMPETVKAETAAYHVKSMSQGEYPTGATLLKEDMVVAPGTVIYENGLTLEEGEIQYMSADGKTLLYDPYNDPNNQTEAQHKVWTWPQAGEDFGGWRVTTLSVTSGGAILNMILQPAKAGEILIYYITNNQWFDDGSYVENDPENPTSFMSGENKVIHDAIIKKNGVSVSATHHFLGWFLSDDPKEEAVDNTEDLADAPGYAELLPYFENGNYNIKYYSVSGNELSFDSDKYVDHVAFADITKNPTQYTEGKGVANLGPAKWDEQYGYYDFIGWSIYPDFIDDDEPFESISRSKGYNITLYAHFAPSNFNIIYECGDGGSVSNNPTEYAYEDTIALGTGDGEIKDPIANPGYVFAGWYQTPDYSDEQFTGITDTTHGDITLYAKWNTADYNITLDPAGGTVEENDYSSVSGNYVKGYSVTSESFTLPTPAKEGYTFSGWKQGDGQAQATVTITKGTTGDKAYTAVWTPNTYQVTFNKNHTDSDGQGSMNPQSFTYDEAAKSLTTNAFKRTNYNFTGWAKTATATDAEFTDKQAVRNLTTTANGNVDLYALWAPKKYNITYYGADGQVDATATKVNPAQYTYGQELLTGNEAGKIQDAPADDGYSFTGWYRSTDFTQSRIEKITSTDSGDISLYAGFAPKDYTITYMVDGKAYTSNINPATYTYKTGVSELKNESKAGYTFSGWFDAAENGNPVTAIADTKKVDITLYGTFTAIPMYTVKFTDEDDSEIFSSEYYENTKASQISVPSDPVKAPDAAHSYTFTGWTPALTDVTGPATYKATYRQEARKYTITWVDGDGNTIKQDTKEYGTVSGNFVIPDTDREPTAEYTYTFTGWEPAITDVTGDATYTATYSKVKNQYKITWVDADGNTIKEALLDYGTVLDDSIVPEAPTMESTKEYTCAFTGWEPAIAKVTGDATYKATYSQTKNQFTITWVDGDGKTLKTESVAYGETPAYGGVDPTKAETDHYTYTFNKKWSPEIVAATADATYTAQFDWTLKEGADPFLDKDNTEEDTKGTKFSILFPRIAKVTKNSVQIKWRPVEGADGYLVYGSQCNSGGVKRYFARMAETDAGTTSYTAKKLKRASYYKFYVVAYKNTADGQEALAKTKRIHVTTLNKKTGDATDLKIYRIADSKKKAMKKKLSLEEKGSVTIFATEVNKQHKLIKRHKAIGVESDQPDVVKVTDLSGKKAQKRKIKLTGLKKGTANVYIYAQNGLYKTIKVTVQ